MSDTTDDMEFYSGILESNMEAQAKLDRLRENMMPHHIWVTSGGVSKINIKDMSNSHIVNALNMLRAKQKEGAFLLSEKYTKFWINLFKNEIKERVVKP